MRALLVMAVVVMEAAVLQAATVPSCGDGFYRASSGAICCQKCSQGSYLQSDCTVEYGPPSCDVCVPGTFTEFPNSSGKCIICTPCQPDEDEEQECSTTADRRCRCKPGYHKRGSEHFCREDSVAPVTSSTTRPPDSGGSDAGIVVAVILALLGGVGALGIAVFVYKMCTGTFPWNAAHMSRRNANPQPETGPPSPHTECILPPIQPELEEVEEEEVVQDEVDEPREQAPLINGVTRDGTGMQTSLNKYDRVIKDAELPEVHDILRGNAAVGDYARVMRLAGLEEVHVEEARFNHRGDVNEQNYDMLRRWLTARGKARATYGELTRALERAGCNRAAASLAEMCGGLASPGRGGGGEGEGAEAVEG
ncbi:tumor necrosis factor receptor superfamily member 6-like [Petromyzon marinus]|uniref:tumor necrosis factor receptor superfamily member 6-like n=1 Tax=Petromyzon marinus TaxID=7757 RepID=UPI003F722713